FNPVVDVFERSAKTFGPSFSERAVTVGAHKLNVNLSYSYIKFDRLNGHDLDHLTSRVIVADTPSGTRAFDGILAPSSVFQQVKGINPNLRPNNTFAREVIDLDLEAQLFNMSVTYGVRDDLDINVNVPLLRTFVRSSLTSDALDPRYARLFNAPASTVVENA